MSKTTVEERAKTLAPLLRQDSDHASVWYAPSNTQSGVEYRLQLITDGDIFAVTCTCAYGLHRPQSGRAGCSHAAALRLRLG